MSHAKRLLEGELYRLQEKLDDQVHSRSFTAGSVDAAERKLAPLKTKLASEDSAIQATHNQINEVKREIANLEKAGE